MRAPAILLAACGACLLFGCPAHRWDEQALHFRQPPGSITKAELSRPRYAFQARETSAKLQARGVDLQVSDPRDPNVLVRGELPALALAAEGQTREVGMPSGFEAGARERLGALVAGAGPQLLLEGRIKLLTVVREQQERTILAVVDWSLSGPQGPLFAGQSDAGYKLSGPPHDARELEDIHRGALLAALDAFVARPELIEIVNLKLATPAAPVPQSTASVLQTAH